MDAGHAGLVAVLVLTWVLRRREGRPRGSVTLADWHRWLAERRAACGREGRAS